MKLSRVTRDRLLRELLVRSAAPREPREQRDRVSSVLTAAASLLLTILALYLFARL
jgi:hypothetical protein